MLEFLLLTSLQRYASVGLLVLRVCIGTFLLANALPVLTEPGGWREYAVRLSAWHFPAPYFTAHLSVYAQLLAGTGMVLGLATRWAGLLCATHFTVAWAMLDYHGRPYALFHSLVMIALGVTIAFQGSGRFAIDGWLERAPRQRFDVHY